MREGGICQEGGGAEETRRRGAAAARSLRPSAAAAHCPPHTMAALFSFFPTSKVGSEEKDVRSIVTSSENRKSNLPKVCSGKKKSTHSFHVAIIGKIIDFLTSISRVILSNVKEDLLIVLPRPLLAGSKEASSPGPAGWVTGCGFYPQPNHVVPLFA